MLLGEEPGPALRIVRRAEQCRNLHAGDRRRRFLIDPGQQISIERTAREEGLLVLGYYHSHPSSAAHFSAHDRAEAHPWVSNLVVALRGGRFWHARCYRVTPEGVVEEEALEGPDVASRPGSAARQSE